jgi:hypothetical protein
MLSIIPKSNANFGLYFVNFKAYKRYQKYIQYEKTKSALNAASYIILTKQKLLKLCNFNINIIIYIFIK